jgi:RHS repeat-associated protein
VTDWVEYSAYGTTGYRSGTTDTPFLYNGRYGVQTDPNGLLYMRARYYNPYLGRFLNPDPIGFSGGMNFYAAFDGNPISYLDPFGFGATEPNQSWISGSLNFLDRLTLGPESRRLMSAYQDMGAKNRASMPAFVQSTLNFLDVGLDATHGIGLGVPTGPVGSIGRVSNALRISTSVTGFSSGAQNVYRTFKASTADDALLGFVQRGKVHLFSQEKFIAGHMSVIESGAIKLTRDTMGFQVVRYEGRIRFHPISGVNALNNVSPEGKLPPMVATQVKELLSL